MSLNFRNTRPWKISRIINNKTYKPKISQHMKNTSLIPIFHSWKLNLVSNNPFPYQVLPPKSLMLIQNNNDNIHNKWKILDIIDCCKTKKHRIQYKATYIGNWKKWNTALAWQSWTDFKNAREKICKFHKQYSKKPTAPLKLTSNNKYDPETMH